jgi:hypothetical protein
MMTKKTNIDNEIEFEGEETLEDHSLANKKSIELQYPNIQIKIIPQNFSIFELKRGYDIRKDLELDPEFQRKPMIWSKKQQSELIESILMGIPIPILYFFENTNGKRQIVDGRQRLSCIFRYMDNQFKLDDLDKLKDLNKLKFSDLEPKNRSKIEDYQFTIYTIQPPTPERVKFDIFDRVNRGGTQLNNQEMRNALYSGISTNLLKDLSESEEFKKATGNGVSDRRMKDRYIILRYLAFYILETKKLAIENENDDYTIIEYKSDMDEFLAETMSYLNNLNDDKVENLKKIFFLAMNNCYKTLGEDAFRFNKKEDKASIKRPINMGLFESLGFLFSREIDESINKEDLKKQILELKEEMDKSEYFRGIIDSNQGVLYRFEKIKELIKKITK